MTVFYKFMPLRKEFFEDPLLRLTPPYALNDPFDSKPSSFAISKKINFLFEGKGRKSQIAHYKKSISDNINRFGIISLTKDPKNILMWSHYASEHHGMVIGIDCDSSTFKFHDNYSSHCKTKTNKPLKVLYSRYRPSENIPDSAIYEYYDDNFNRLFMLTKSRCWSYEKEYRYLISLWEADAAIAKCNDLEWLESCDKRIKISKVSNENYKFEISCDENKKSLQWFLALSEGSGKIRDVKLFKRINRESIKSVYFGSRVCDDDIKILLKKIKKFNKNIVVKKSIESTDEFAIDLVSL